MVLDEPTAALDPIAENKLYLQYRELTREKTSIYISHRFASTRFCDRIILLEDGAIKESGTHEELMRKKGRYAEMFEIQSQYYREEKKSFCKMPPPDDFPAFPAHSGHSFPETLPLRKLAKYVDEVGELMLRENQFSAGTRVTGTHRSR